MTLEWNAAMPVATETITAQELLRMGDMGPCELIEGVIVKMAPAGAEHGRIVLKLGALLLEHVEARGLGMVCAGDTGIVLERDPDTVRGPDVLFVRSERVPKGGKIRVFLSLAPDLVAEIVSPSDRWSAVEKKISEFLDFGVPLVWVIDPETRRVHVYRKGYDVRVLGPDDTLTGGHVLPEFSCKLRDILA